MVTWELYNCKENQAIINTTQCPLRCVQKSNVAHTVSIADNVFGTSAKLVVLNAYTFSLSAIAQGWTVTVQLVKWYREASAAFHFGCSIGMNTHISRVWLCMALSVGAQFARCHFNNSRWKKIHFEQHSDEAKRRREPLHCIEFVGRNTNWQWKEWYAFESRVVKTAN